jgi:hypothetical protein
MSVDVLTYAQLTYLLNLLETLVFVLGEDKKIKNLIEKDTVLQKILKPYFVTKQKKVTPDALDAAVKKMLEYPAMQAERAKWQGILDKLETKAENYFHQMELYLSKTFMDSYYGDMGGICLSGQPEQIRKSGFFVQRLVDQTDKEIVGMSVLFLSPAGFSSTQIQAKYYWQAFAFNPLHSVLSHCTLAQQQYLYLQYRLNMEKLALQTKLPVVISGIGTGWGLISNDQCFSDLIRAYEIKKTTAKRVYNAKGLAVYYDENQFANALVIIDPRGYENQAPEKIPTFYAHRELPQFQW